MGLSADDRILWGTSEAAYFSGNRVDPECDHSPAHYAALRSSFRRHFPVLASLEFVPFPDVQPALDALRDRRLLVVSNWDCSLAEWLEIRRRLLAADGISGVEIVALSMDAARLRLALRNRPDDAQGALLAAGVWVDNSQGPDWRVGLAESR